MLKHFRAWDGEKYWYTDDKWRFINDFKLVTLENADFKIKHIDQWIGKTDSNGVKIYENDLLNNPHQDLDKLFQVIWSANECGFRKVPYGIPMPETKIDEAFMIVIGTIHSKGE